MREWLIRLNYIHMFQQLRENKDLLIVAFASFFIGFGAASFFGDNSGSPALSPSESDPTKTLSPLPFNNETAGTKRSADEAYKTSLLMIENQRAGASVLVKKAELSETRWIVIQEKDEDGSMGSILGAGWFPAGVHENVPVPLLRETVSGEEYYGVLYTDLNQDKQFDHKIDKLAEDMTGNATSFSTVASADGE